MNVIGQSNHAHVVFSSNQGAYQFVDAPAKSTEIQSSGPGQGMSGEGSRMPLYKPNGMGAHVDHVA